MKKTTTTALTLTAVLALTACGGGGDDSTTQTPTVATGTGYYLDSAVEGIDYTCGSQSGKTDKEGKFTFEEGKECQFTLAGIPVKSIAAEQLHDGVKIVEDDLKVAKFLQSIDADGDPTNGITIDDQVLETLTKALETVTDKTQVIADETVMTEVVATVGAEVEDVSGELRSDDEVEAHLTQTQTEVTKEYLVGNTWYLPVTDIEYKHVEKLTFNTNGVLHIEWNNPDGSYQTSDTISYSIDGNKVHFSGTDGNGEPIDKIVEFIAFSNDKLSMNEEGALYKNEADAEAYLATLSTDQAGSTDLNALVGKTVYQYCADNNELFQMTFQDDGQIEAKEYNETFYIPYRIDDNTVYTTEDGTEHAHILLEFTDTYVKFDDGNNETSTFYFTEADARANPRSNCGGESTVSNLEALIVGQTYYTITEAHIGSDGQVVAPHVETVAFSSDGSSLHISWIEDGQTYNRNYTYSVTNDTLTLYAEDGQTLSFHNIQEFDDHITFNEGIMYKTEQAAQNALKLEFSDNLISQKALD